MCRVLNCYSLFGAGLPGHVGCLCVRCATWPLPMRLGGGGRLSARRTQRPRPGTTEALLDTDVRGDPAMSKNKIFVPGDCARTRIELNE